MIPKTVEANRSFFKNTFVSEFPYGPADSEKNGLEAGPSSFVFTRRSEPETEILERHSDLRRKNNRKGGANLVPNSGREAAVSEQMGSVFNITTAKRAA